MVIMAAAWFVSTCAVKNQESNKQNSEFTEENYGWVSRKLEKINIKNCKDLVPKVHLKTRGIPVSNKTITRTGRTDELSGELGEWKYTVFMLIVDHNTIWYNILNVVLIRCDLITDLTEEQNALQTDNKRNNCKQILLPVYISIDELTTN